MQFGYLYFVFVLDFVIVFCCSVRADFVYFFNFVGLDCGLGLRLVSCY